ncbi:MAG: methionine--tRNA ligase [Alphaproteobacteria bacterium]|nr:MAG: methionine--tRNA ligase [Alphaproteobacteria bacterium]
MSKYYVTTPIYYVNADPGLGQVYTSIAADVLARFHRLDGHEVFFLTGTDEHGQKVQKSAQNKGIHPQTYVDEMAQRFVQLNTVFNISNDAFIRTTDERHKQAAQHLWKKLLANDQVYISTYSGWYATRDEAFYDETEIIAGKAPTGAPVEWVEEECYFFRLSQWQDKLLDFYEQNPHFIAPQAKRNEVLGFVKRGLNDICVSRTTFDWGVQVPDAPAHIMYVWIDALTNYITALGYPDVNTDIFAFWNASLHIVGKDILRFHAVYWPAFLMAADLLPPSRLFVHGWWTRDKQKMSKSLGNTLNPFAVAHAYGVDQTRYFLMREMPFGNDGDFSEESLRARITTELSNDLGNLAQRVLSFVHKHVHARIPHPKEIHAVDSALLSCARQALPDMREEMKNQQIHTMIQRIWLIIANANRYVDSQKPWDLRKTDTDRLDTVLYVLLETLRMVGIYLQPLMPDTADKLLTMLGISGNNRTFLAIESAHVSTGETLSADLMQLFPRHEERGNVLG